MSKRPNELPPQYIERMHSALEEGRYPHYAPRRPPKPAQHRGYAALWPVVAALWLAVWGCATVLYFVLRR